MFYNNFENNLSKNSASRSDQNYRLEQRKIIEATATLITAANPNASAEQPLFHKYQKDAIDHVQHQQELDGFVDSPVKLDRRKSVKSPKNLDHEKGDMLNTKSHANEMIREEGDVASHVLTKKSSINDKSRNGHSQEVSPTHTTHFDDNRDASSFFNYDDDERRSSLALSQNHQHAPPHHYHNQQQPNENRHG